ncbi:uncharacterized protein LOC129806058 [Phlebotomus papatasi]|uniref:uncharacterized protein LOC129806058 n=1 Tax=Phlebotomus papatasi TaxID=29031 RepID=UPI00248386B8|nr:uncharacterized protein LOC129806058 [Phlebotomus papatasi]
MPKYFVLCLLVILCVDFALPSPLVGRSGSGKSTSGRRGYIGPQSGSDGAAAKTQTQKKQGLWGIVTLIMFVVLLGFGGYYGYICFPFLCKKERHYDVMDAESSTSASTPTTRSAAEFEKMDPEFDENSVFRYK